MAYFIEQNDELFASQLDTFASQLSNYKTDLGFSDDDVKEAKADAAYMKWAVKTDRIYEDYAHGYKAFIHMARHAKTSLPLTPPAVPVIEAAPSAVNSGIQARFANKANRARAAAGATETILKALGIVAPASNGGNPKASPDLQVPLSAGYPELSFHMHGHAAINIYRDAGSGSKLFKTLHRSGYKDTDLPAAGVAAEYKYKAIFVEHDQETGSMSAEVSVAVVGR